MTTEPLIDRNLGLYADKLVVNAVSIQQIEAAARALRAREFDRLVRAVFAWLYASIVAPIASAVRAERAYRELMALDDRTLADIGLRREEIPSHVARAMTARSEETAPRPAAPKAEMKNGPGIERKLAA
ncbi:MAG: DUF1127 domain-containing protein [Alphaproteobacteria bacterium]|nr:DUF1127 domain-containing protein [Alphaproteobacteria bacterium]